MEGKEFFYSRKQCPSVFKLWKTTTNIPWNYGEKSNTHTHSIMGKGKKFLNLTGGKTHAVRTLALPHCWRMCSHNGKRQQAWEQGSQWQLKVIQINKKYSCNIKPIFLMSEEGLECGWTRFLIRRFEALHFHMEEVWRFMKHCYMGINK